MLKIDMQCSYCTKWMAPCFNGLLSDFSQFAIRLLFPCLSGINDPLECHLCQMDKELSKTDRGANFGQPEGA